MRRLVAWNLMTLDGYFEGRNPWDLGFHETVWGDELSALSLEQGKEIGTLLFGRRAASSGVGHRLPHHRRDVLGQQRLEFGEKRRQRQPLGPCGVRRDRDLDGNTVRWFGVAICAFGGIPRLAPVFVLKDRFSGLVAIQAEHKLERRGIYGLVRNPSYLGMLVSPIGRALAFRSIVGVLLSTLLLFPIIPRIRSEERLLREHFGREYDDYFARTWRLLPWIY